MVVLPDFLIVGGGKCGTTALKNYLNVHPDVFIPESEVHFFDDNYYRGLSWYSLFFVDGGDKTVGDKSPGYMFKEDACRRIHTVLPRVKLIFLLRNPIDRAFSEYRMRLLTGREQGVFEDVIKRNTVYLEQGFYVDQIKRFLRFFPKEQMFVIISEEFKKDKQETLKDVLEFLDVSSSFVFPVLREEHVGLRGYSSLFGFLLRLHNRMGIHGFKKVSSRVRDLFIALDRWKTPMTLNSDVRSKMVEFYRESKMELECLIDKDLSIWWE